MGLLSWLGFRSGEVNHQGVIDNGNTDSSVGPNAWNPGDPDGIEITDADNTSEFRHMSILPSPWSGWPMEWNVPAWGDAGVGLNRLVDTAWACLDLNSSVLSTMPLYRVRGGQIQPQKQWMINPDPDVYTSVEEFLKQLFWDYLMGEAFVMATDWYGEDGRPSKFHVVNPALIKVEMDGLRRRYFIGQQELDPRLNEILHIRYRSRADQPRGEGPLEVAGARMVAAGLLAKYVTELSSNGGVPYLVLESERRLSPKEARDLQTQFVQSRIEHLGEPAVVSGGVKANRMQMNAKEMALLEIAQFTEARISTMLGVPPFLVGLPSGGDPMTYSTVSQLFDFHDRASLRPKARTAMQALSGWLLPAGNTLELNRDEYARPALKERAEAYKLLWEMGALSPEEIKTMERLHGPVSATALTGGETNGREEPVSSD